MSLPYIHVAVLGAVGMQRQLHILLDVLLVHPVKTDLLFVHEA